MTSAGKRVPPSRTPEIRRAYEARYRAANREKIAARAANPAARKRQKAYLRGYHLQRKYGITPADLDAMVDAQGARCAICYDGLRAAHMVVDHDHDTGAVRGILCRSCNGGIGLLKDSPDILRSALTYLRAA